MKNNCDVSGEWPYCSVSTIVDCTSACEFADMPKCRHQVWRHCINLSAIRAAIEAEREANERNCHNCKHDFLYSDEYPCSECVYPVSVGTGRRRGKRGVMPTIELLAEVQALREQLAALKKDAVTLAQWISFHAPYPVQYIARNIFESNGETFAPACSNLVLENRKLAEELSALKKDARTAVICLRRFVDMNASGIMGYDGIVKAAVDRIIEGTKEEINANNRSN